MFIRDRLTNPSYDLIWIQAVMTLQFLDDHEAFFTVDFNRECRSGACAQTFNAALYSGFYVVRIMILSSNNDELFDSSGDVQCAFIDESKIARAQEWPVIGSRQTRVEGLGCLRRPVVITAGDAWSTNPYLAHLVCAARCQRFRIDDDHFLFLNATAGHERRAVRL